MIVEQGGAFSEETTSILRRLILSQGTIQGRGRVTVNGPAVFGDGLTPSDQTFADGVTVILNGDTTRQSKSAIFDGATLIIGRPGSLTNLGDVQGPNVFDNEMVSAGLDAQALFIHGALAEKHPGIKSTIAVPTTNRGGKIHIGLGSDVIFEKDLIFETDLGVRDARSSPGSVGASSAAGIQPRLELPITGPVNSNLDVNANFALDGELVLDFKYSPKVGDIITVFTYDRHTGAFDVVTGAGLASGYVLRAIYNADNLQVEVLAVPEPETYAMMLIGLAIVVFMARRRIPLLRA